MADKRGRGGKKTVRKVVDEKNLIRGSNKR
jgi:hypothetical protein